MEGEVIVLSNRLAGRRGSGWAVEVVQMLEATDTVLVRYDDLCLCILVTRSHTLAEPVVVVIDLMVQTRNRKSQRQCSRLGLADEWELV